MPHIILETTTELAHQMDATNLFPKIHSFLAETLPTTVDHCKSRLIASNSYVVGEGLPGRHFIHVTIQALPGRAEEVIQRAGQGSLDLVKSHLEKVCPNIVIEYSLEFSPLSAYFKG